MNTNTRTQNFEVNDVDSVMTDCIRATRSPSFEEFFDLAPSSDGSSSDYSDDEEPIALNYPISFAGRFTFVETIIELRDFISECYPANFYDLECFFQGRLLRYNVSLEDQNFSPSYTNRIMAEFYFLQGGTTADGEETLGEFEKMFKLVIPQIAKSNFATRDRTQDTEVIQDFVENIIYSYKYLYQCSSYYDWCALTYKLFTKKSWTRMISDKLSSIFASEVQADTGDFLKTLRFAMDKVEDITENKLLQKLSKAYSFLLTQGFLAKFGFELNEEEYTRLELKTYQVAFSSKKKMCYALFDAALFLIERLHDFYLTKDISVFSHGDSEYTEWCVEADTLMSLAAYTGNMEPHGLSYFEFLTRLDECIEKGEAYIRYSTSKGKIESKPLQKKVYSLCLIKRAELCSKSALQMRKAPFGLLIAGHSSVAKSSFSQMCFYHFAKMCDLPCDDQFMYNRNPLEDHWNNFKTSMWCIRIDDAAMFKPSKMADVDPSLRDIIGISNNVPTSPPQAALEDKGKTPVRAELLIATTNTIDLNAHEYFACPLAVQRRLPYVVNIVPKKEFQHQNGHFIEPSKLVTPEGEYPNFWDIHLYEIRPEMQGKIERARLVKVNHYSDVNMFLKDYTKSFLNHRANQNKATGANEGMRDLKICKKCYIPAKGCPCFDVQVEEVETVEVPYQWQQSRPIWESTASDTLSFLYNLYCRFLMWRLQLSWNMWLLHHVMQYTLLRNLVYKFLLCGLPDTYHLRVLGFLNGLSLRPHQWTRRIQILKGVMVAAGLMLVAYSANSYLKKKSTKPTKTTETEDIPVQGNVFGTTEDQFVKETKSNVWYNPTVQLTTSDLPLCSQSLVGKNQHELRDLFGKNIVRLEVSHEYMNGDSLMRHHRKMNGVYVKGTYIMANSHLFREGGETYDVTVICTDVSNGINSNVSFKIKRSQIQFEDGSDVCVFQTLSLPPRKDILKFWVEQNLPLSQCCEIGRTASGNVEVKLIHGVNVVEQMPIADLGISLDVALGVAESPTKDGDCGALLVSMSPKGAFPCGIHVIGRERHSGSIYITRDKIESLIRKIETKYVVPLNVQGGGEPKLSLENKTVTIGQLHHKSTLRYINDAKISVMGSFTGFRSKPKSSVCATPLEDEFLEHYQVPQNFGAPRMSGWAPWRNNLVEMVKCEDNIDMELLEFCAEDYLSGVLQNLPKEWEKDLVFLSNKAAVNGIPGVQYIDSINRQSSMGAPWNKSKKDFLVPDACEKYPDGVNFPSEFWDRVHHIEECWSEGRRAYPVFTGHLKDEATAKSKIAIDKLRVFTGAPADWSVASRKKLLSFVRLLQRNKLVFEAAPGTVCQSSEWHHFRKYLTHFGLDRMIAGDYGKFDKRMIARIIVMAFWIIARIYHAAGFSAGECREIMCIGYDVAFSWCNFNGDLVEFLGTNPSGHPFTVIINSIVNSLYMRYAFYTLRPTGETCLFKEFVRLLTYGDDNVFGVHRSADWFNHTAIAKVMKSINVEYTMADKGAESIPFIHINDVSFLKRRWVWNEDLNKFLCPLDEQSIIKSLTMWVPSSTVCKWEQMCDVITSANNEYFFYGREKFEEKREYFLKMLEKEPLCHYTRGLPTWNDLVERYRRSSASMDVEYAYLYTM